jgi:hypothetical protein
VAVHGTAFTRSDLENHLLSHGVPQETLDRLKDKYPNTRQYMYALTREHTGQVHTSTGPTPPPVTTRPQTGPRSTVPRTAFNPPSNPVPDGTPYKINAEGVRSLSDLHDKTNVFLQSQIGEHNRGPVPTWDPGLRAIGWAGANYPITGEIHLDSSVESGYKAAWTAYLSGRHLSDPEKVNLKFFLWTSLHEEMHGVHEQNADRFNDRNGRLATASGLGHALPGGEANAHVSVEGMNELATSAMAEDYCKAMLGDRYSELNHYAGLEGIGPTVRMAAFGRTNSGYQDEIKQAYRFASIMSEQAHMSPTEFTRTWVAQGYYARPIAWAATKTGIKAGFLAEGLIDPHVLQREIRYIREGHP